MAQVLACCVLFLAAQAVDCVSTGRGAFGARREAALLQTWGKALNGAKAHETPVTRVVNLLKEMQGTLKSEMEEDEGLFTKLKCWCNGNVYAKEEAIGNAEAKIAGLEATIEALTAKSAELKNKIKETEEELAADKKSLAEATAMREKEAKAFHAMEMDAVQDIENLKAAITVLGKHQSDNTNWHDLLQLSFIQTGKEAAGHPSSSERAYDRYLTEKGFDSYSAAEPQQGFLQQARPASVDPQGLTAAEMAVVKLGLKTQAAFLQAHSEGGESSGPGGGATYQSRSGEILGIMAQTMDEMKADLSAEQKEESERAAAFAELRNAKNAEIADGEKLAETKEDELATTDNDLAEAKEDLGQTEATLGEDQKFLKDNKKTCADAEAAFDERKKARLAEIEAVSETIEILTGDDARDAMTATYSFLQASSHKANSRVKAAVKRLRKAGKKFPELSLLASSMELDSFAKVKKAIDDMITALKTQQADEVKKNDWCKSELQENEMATAGKEDKKKDEEAKIATLGSDIERLTEEIAAAKKAIADAQLALQRASENRKMENLEFQKTIADQHATIEVMEVALNRLAQFYDKASLLQVHQDPNAPPVPQMEYAPSQGASGVMSMIEKLIYEAKELMADAKKEEMEATTEYENLVADTFASVLDLQKQVTTMSENKAKAAKDKLATESDLTDTVMELEELAKMNAEVHAECDYVLKNFMIRQKARAEEIEALQQAMQILSGASLG